MSLGTAWLCSVLAGRIGIPQIDPSLGDSPRPLETLGMITAALPVSLCAGLLTDRAGWLTSASPRGPARLRSGWMALSVAFMLTVGLAWSLALPSAVPAHQTFGAWVLLSGCAGWATVVLRADVSVVGPLVVVVPLSIGGLVPFEGNLLYNVHLGNACLATGTLVLAGAMAGYAVWGDGEARREP